MESLLLINLGKLCDPCMQEVRPADGNDMNTSGWKSAAKSAPKINWFL